MPSLLNNQQFPTGYEPWYVFEAELVATPRAFDKFDVLVATAGKYNRVANDAVLVTGYVIALEKYESGMQKVAVAAVGSLVPSVLGGAVQSNGLLKVSLTSDDGMRLVAANAADLAAGKVVGRYRNNSTNHKLLTAGVENDIIDVLTGAI